jgi:hypothetical protein
LRWWQVVCHNKQLVVYYKKKWKGERRQHIVFSIKKKKFPGLGVSGFFDNLLGAWAWPVRPNNTCLFFGFVFLIIFIFFSKFNWYPYFLYIFYFALLFLLKFKLIPSFFNPFTHLFFSSKFSNTSFFFFNSIPSHWLYFGFDLIVCFSFHNARILQYQEKFPMLSWCLVFVKKKINWFRTIKF